MCDTLKAYCFHKLGSNAFLNTEKQEAAKKHFQPFARSFEFHKCLMSQKAYWRLWRKQNSFLAINWAAWAKSKNFLLTCNGRRRKRPYSLWHSNTIEIGEQNSDLEGFFLVWFGKCLYGLHVHFHHIFLKMNLYLLKIEPMQYERPRFLKLAKCKMFVVLLTFLKRTIIL